MLNVLFEMDKRGYDVEWKVYNSKDYGVPQNRERVYIVGHIRDGGRRQLLPIKRENTTTIKQIVGGSQGERVYDSNGISCTLSSNGGGLGAKTGLYYFIDLSYRKKLTSVSRCLVSRYTSIMKKKGVEMKDGYAYIRRLTPKECWRLQGLNDNQFNKAKAVNSDSQLYKQAGNAVTVNVVEEIGKHIMKVIIEERGGRE